MKVYVAASWRTPMQPLVVAAIRSLGHEVYDFKQDGFSWLEIDGDWKEWTPKQSREALSTVQADRGFKRDKDALDWCDVCVLVLPSGRSSHLELGYAIGKGKVGIVYWPEQVHPYDPDLMYKLCDYFVITPSELVNVLKRETSIKEGRLYDPDSIR